MPLNAILFFTSLWISYFIIGYLFKHLSILYYVVKTIKLNDSKYTKQDIKQTYNRYWTTDSTDLGDVVRTLRSYTTNANKPWFDDSFAFFGILFWPVLLPIVLFIYIKRTISKRLPDTANPFIKIMECTTADKCDITANLKANLKG